MDRNSEPCRNGPLFQSDLLQLQGFFLSGRKLHSVQAGHWPALEVQLIHPINDLPGSRMHGLVSRSEDHAANELRQRGESARRRRDLTTAIRHYEEASKLLRDSPDRLKFAHTVRHLGDVYMEQADCLRAEPCYIEALAIYRGHPSPARLDLANAIRAYAVLMTGTRRRDESRPLWTEAAGLYKNLGIAAGVEECARRLHQLDTAIE